MKLKPTLILSSLLFIIFLSSSISYSIHTVKTLHTTVFVKHLSERDLDISLDIETEWMREPTTDLPHAVTRLNFKIYSISHILDASLTTTILHPITAAIGDLQPGINGFSRISVYSYYDEFQDSGKPYSEIPYSLKVYLIGKTLRGFVYTTRTLNFKVKFPRYFDERVVRLYVTPNNPTIKELASNITGYPKWLALCNWVSYNIQYKYDTDVHGVRNFWQLPIETLQLKTGDCEDYAILLCSLLRASGYDENSAFVVLGYTNKTGHAWVRIYAQIEGTGTWINIEPQIGGVFTIIYGFLNIAEYDEAYQFNDVYFEKLK